MRFKHHRLRKGGVGGQSFAREASNPNQLRIKLKRYEGLFLCYL